MLDEMQKRRLSVIERREETIRQVLGELEVATQYDPGQREYRVQMEELLGRTRELAMGLEGRESKEINSHLVDIRDCYVGSLKYLEREFFEDDPRVEEITLRLHAPMFTLVDMYLLGFGK